MLCTTKLAEEEAFLSEARVGDDEAPPATTKVGSRGLHQALGETTENGHLMSVSDRIRNWPVQAQGSQQNQCSSQRRHRPSPRAAHIDFPLLSKLNKGHDSLRTDRKSTRLN